jgi:hypothetical protein
MLGEGGSRRAFVVFFLINLIRLGDEVILKFAPDNLIGLCHGASLKKLVQHLDVARARDLHSVVVGTQAVPQLSDNVRPLLKRREVVSMLKAWEFANLVLKVGLRVHGCEIVRWHIVILDSLKKMRTDAVRVTVGVLQGEVIVLFGVFVVAGDCWAEVLKGSHQQVMQKELRVLVHALAGGVGMSRVRGVGFACRVVVDQSPGSGVRMAR